MVLERCGAQPGRGTVVKEEKEKGRLKVLEFVQVGNGESFLLV
jgi:hypothetical protein